MPSLPPAESLRSPDWHLADRTPLALAVYYEARFQLWSRTHRWTRYLLACALSHYPVELPPRVDA